MLEDRPHPRKPCAVPERTDDEISRRAEQIAADLQSRRTVRHFSGRPVPRRALEAIVRAGASAPSGANQQPWHFVVVQDEGLRGRIRRAAEAEEEAFYDHRAPDEWKQALHPIGTTADKAFLDQAGALIVIFVERRGSDKSKRYYARESVGIATGLLISAAHQAGLATLTYTPSPMAFLGGMLGRGDHESPFLVLAVGFPHAAATVPDIGRKNLEQVATFL